MPFANVWVFLHVPQTYCSRHHRLKHRGLHTNLQLLLNIIVIITSVFFPFDSADGGDSPRPGKLNRATAMQYKVNK